MIVVLEGPDGGGKSSLAALMSLVTGLRVQQGAGPPRHPGEIEARLVEYLAMDDVIFDRHPAISQPIYAALRGELLSAEFHELAAQFYSLRPVVVYCRSTSPDRHVVKPGEDPAHVAALTRRYSTLVEMYDLWSVKRAHLLFRIDDDPIDVVRVVASVLAGSP